MILIAGAICAFQRRHRSRKHARDSIKWPPSDTGSSFSGLSKVSAMRPVTTDTYQWSNMGWDTQPRFTGATTGPAEPLLAYTRNDTGGVHFASIGASTPSYQLEPYSEPRVVSDYRTLNTGRAVTTGQQTVRLSVVSSASTPSLYSDMRSAEDDADSLYEREMGTSPGGNGPMKTQHAAQYSYQPLAPPGSWSKPANPGLALPTSNVRFP